ncbi:hypothetical protein EOM60_04180 [Candidatus Saccharibacteria bacterium]|nr:hypothetical protein [Candidatus Saccharibacteria bacterium]
MTQRPKFAKSSVDTENSNGEITFIAARNVKNLNGFEYQTETLLAQDATGEYAHEDGSREGCFCGLVCFVVGLAIGYPAWKFVEKRVRISGQVSL